MSNVISSDLCHQTSNLKKKILKNRGRYVSPLLHKDGPWLCFNVILIIKSFNGFKVKLSAGI